MRIGEASAGERMLRFISRIPPHAAVDRLETIDEVVEKYCVASSPAKSRVYVGMGMLFLGFAVIGIWVPGWPTVSWAVPAAFLFSMSSEKMFRLTLTNRYFGTAMFEYYATGKTIPKHAKYGTVGLIALMASISAYFVWFVSTRGDGILSDPSSWNGADPGFGAGTVILVGLIGMWYVGFRVPTRK
ncbi:MAG: YbaN family protein [Candidatus Thalassarchaeum sp.]